MNYFRYFAYFFHICSALHTFIYLRRVEPDRWATGD